MHSRILSLLLTRCPAVVGRGYKPLPERTGPHAQRSAWHGNAHSARTAWICEAANSSRTDELAQAATTERKSTLWDVLDCVANGTFLSDTAGSDAAAISTRLTLRSPSYSYIIGHLSSHLGYLRLAWFTRIFCIASRIIFIVINSYIFPELCCVAQVKDCGSSVRKNKYVTSTMYVDVQ